MYRKDIYSRYIRFTSFFFFQWPRTLRENILLAKEEVSTGIFMDPARMVSRQEICKLMDNVPSKVNRDNVYGNIPDTFDNTIASSNRTCSEEESSANSAGHARILKVKMPRNELTINRIKSRKDLPSRCCECKAVISSDVFARDKPLRHNSGM